MHKHEKTRSASKLTDHMNKLTTKLKRLKFVQNKVYMYQVMCLILIDLHSQVPQGKLMLFYTEYHVQNKVES